MLKSLFNEKKAAQSAAYFLLRAGGSLSVLKLTKLLYLAERRSFEKFSEPMIGDQLVSMPHGPVLSRTYNHMNGELNCVNGGWEHWIADRANHDVALRDPESFHSPEEDLLELSEADLEVLREIWDQFGKMSAWQLREYSHRNCPERKDPDGSMIPIRFADLFDALNFTPEQKREALSRLTAQNEIGDAFASSRP